MFWQAARHVVKGRGKIRQLLTASYGGACGEIAAAQPFGGLADLFDRPGNAPRQHHAQNAADNRMTAEDSKNIVRMERI